MSVRLLNNSGNGTVVDGSIISYSYSEDVTALQPGSSSGGTGQVTITAVEVAADKVGNTHPNTKLMINNTITLEDSDFGSVSVQVKKISTNAGVASIVGDTAQWRLNTNRVAPSVGGQDAPLPTIASAIYTYCGLVDIIPTIEPDLEAELDAIPVNFIGWSGNVWEHLKMLCSAVSSSTLTTSGIEVFVDDTGVTFRKALNRVDPIADLESEISFAVDTFDAARQVGLYSYNTSYGLDKVIYEASNYADGVDPANTFLASLTDGMTVEAGQTITKVFKMDATLEYVNQPVCVSTITRTYPAPYDGDTGEYVIVGTDNLPIDPTQWEELGGTLIIALTDNPDEIEVTITAPPEPEIGQAIGGGVGYAPYKIGVEVADDAEYPAFWITGTGVFFNKRLHQYGTGADTAYAAKIDGATIDNPFITTEAVAKSRGVAAAQAACGPTVTMSSTVASASGFSQAIGTTIMLESNRFRIETASYSENTVTLTGSACAVIGDFNDKWNGKTFADFTDIALSELLHPDEALKFNEFTVIPLMEAQ